MFRRIAFAASCAVLVAALPALPAHAGTTVPPPAGEMTCGLDGTFTMKQPLPNANSETGATKRIRVKITAKISACNNAGVTGGKMPITTGTLKASGYLDEGASCADISDGSAPDFTFDDTKLDIKWTGTSATGRGHPTVGRSRTAVFSTGDALFGGWEYWSDTFGENDAFANQSATLDLLIENSFTVFACTRSMSDEKGPVTLGAVAFSSAKGSQIIVGP
jgi:uncharacterized protein YcnI